MESTVQYSMCVSQGALIHLFNQRAGSQQNKAGVRAEMGLHEAVKASDFKGMP